MQKKFTKVELKLILTNAISRDCEFYIGGFPYEFDFSLDRFIPKHDSLVLTDIPLIFIESVSLKEYSYTEMEITFNNNRANQSFIIKEKVNPVELLIFNEWWRN